MQAITIPYSGELLVSHLAAYGLALVLDTVDVDAFVHHDPHSLSFEPIVEYDAVDEGFEAAAAAIRRTAVEAHDVVEADIEPGKKGNDRRAVIWARATFANDPTRAAPVLTRRAEHVVAAESADARIVTALLAGLGAPATWGPERVKPSHGATQLDGVLGNNTSDLVRGVLRPARRTAAEIEASTLAARWAGGPPGQQLDKTGWAPPNTPVDLVHQWLAVLGLGLLPVAHRQLARSVTPAVWSRGDGLTLPLLSRPTSVARPRALLGIAALADLGHRDPESPEGSVPAGALGSYGIREVVAFERLMKPGPGTSVAFSFRRGRRWALS